MDSLKILIVEDDYYCSQRLDDCVKKLGHSVTGIAVSVNEGITAFYNQKPDLVIMDIELEDNNEGGILLAKTFNEKERIPIIYYSSNLSNKSLRKKASKTVSTAILSKTFDIDELDANIEKAINENIENEGNPIDRINILFQKVDQIHKFVIKIYQLITSPLHIFTKQKDSFWITTKMGFPRRVFYKDICWVQTYGKNNIRIFTDTEEIDYGVTLSSFERKTNHESLIKVHQSCLINQDKALELIPSENVIIILRNNSKEEIHYSENYIQAFKQSQHFILTRKD